MLSVNKLTILYGKKTLFNDVSARILTNDRIGLIGSNGSGKTTLLRLIAGEHETDEGVVTCSKNATVGYLPQEITSFPQGTTLYEEAETAFSEILSVQEEIESINKVLAGTDHASDDFKNLLARQGHLQHQLDESDIFRMRSQIEKVLCGLGFSLEDLERPCESFSGGWLMRLMLAKLLLRKPSFLLLDEPTNHLDIESVTWIEEFLKNYQGALLIISHDRAFLDNLTSKTWELSLGKLNAYKGNYSFFVKEKENRMEIQRAAYENQQAYIQQTMRFVDRFRSKSTKASQVQSRLKQLEKMEKIELEENEQIVSFRFPPTPPSGKLSLETKNLAKSFGDTKVFSGIDLQLHRGDKLAVVGVNGAGKTTLARLITGLETADSGDVHIGHNVKISYFGQHQARELDPDYTVLESLSHVTETFTITQMRSLLGAFLFRGDDVDKKVAVLSGGEKSRLALARMIAQPANLLIMDEPTNHLDMNSQEVLQEALRQFDGTIIIVSHNRFFLDQFVTRVLEIKKGKAFLHEGSVHEFLEKMKNEEAQPQVIQEKSKPQSPEKAHGKERRQVEAKIRQEKNTLLGPHKKIAEAEEKEIERLETRKSELESILADPDLYQDQNAFAEHSKEYAQLERHLERHLLRWEKSLEKIEAIESQFLNE